MNQHLPVKMHQPGVACRDAAMRRSDEGREQDAMSFANPGNSFAITCDWRLDLDGPALRHFPYAAE
jgi:hypothetical protein